MKCMQKNLTLTNAQRKVLDREIRDELLRLIQAYENDFDIVFAYALNKHFGFGKKRIKRFYQSAISDRVELSRFYVDDNKTDARIDIFAMKKELERKGIVMTDIIAEVFNERSADVEELNSIPEKKGKRRNG